MRSGAADFPVGAAFAVLLALALAIVALGVIATLRMPGPDECTAAPPPPPSRSEAVAAPEHLDPARGIPI
ncbi:hypothetical protein [Kitasatospora sp. NPDC001175]|uniref:hypothetical protein n=1 Tax=Kitasatospora sp. NPDC001175 TaxID=3157103 RepID=UPI003CFF2BE6